MPWLLRSVRWSLTRAHLTGSPCNEHVEQTQPRQTQHEAGVANTTPVCESALRENQGMRSALAVLLVRVGRGIVEKRSAFGQVAEPD